MKPSDRPADPLIIVSGDGHIGCPVEGYREYLDPRYRDMIPELVAEEKDLHLFPELINYHHPGRLALIDERNRIRSGGLRGGWETDQRLRELDAEGIAAEVVFPGQQEGMTPFFYQYNKPYPEDVRIAGIRAYHRWAIDMIAPSKGRLIGTAEPGPCKDMRAAIDELRFVAGHGFRGVFLPGFVPDPALPPLYSSHYEPFWAACNEMQLVLTIHVGYGVKQGEFSNMLAGIKKLAEEGKYENDEDGFIKRMEKLQKLTDDTNPDSIFSLGLAPRAAIWQLIFSGVFDRYPNLKLSMAECRADWFPAYKAHLDAHFLAAQRRPDIKRKPSEYFGENVFITPSSPRRIEAQLRHEIGVNNFLFGSDYPHPEGTWPNTLAWLRAVFYDLPENELRAILGENAIRIYGLDKERLAQIAARIGPAPRDIIGDHRIDERVIKDFDKRSNFTKTTPPLDQKLVDRTVDHDLAAAASGWR